jgi:hypothetical protein
VDLTDPERRLVEHVERGEVLDLTGDSATDEQAMRSWGPSRTVRASVIRDILRGRLVDDPDPHGLRLRGAAIAGRLDLENLRSEVWLELSDCLLADGVNARDANLVGLALDGCRLEHDREPPVDLARIVLGELNLNRAVVAGHCPRGALTLVEAEVGGGIDGAEAVLTNDAGPALDAYGLRVEHHVSVESCRATGAGEQGAVRLTDASIGGQLILRGAHIDNPTGAALRANGMHVAAAVDLRQGFAAEGNATAGAVLLHGARIGGQFEGGGARIRNHAGPALVADAMTAEAGLYLIDGFEAVGTGEKAAVRLPGAEVSGQVSLSGGTFRNPTGCALDLQGLTVGRDLFLAGRFTAAGGGDAVALDLAEVRVGGRLVLDVGGVEHATRQANRVRVDGLAYAGIEDARTWLGTLRDATPAYAPQPYQQLAAVHRAAGHDGEARRVLMAQRRDQIDRGAAGGSMERAWGRVTGLTLGYGYQPWRALLCLLGVLLVGVALSVVLGGRGGLAGQDGAGCTVVEQVGVGLDLGTPLINTGGRAACAPTDSAAGQVLTVGGWMLRLLAWAFATLFVAGFTGAVRKT